MKISLKIKLTVSYVLLSFFIVSSLYITTNYFFEEKFQSYIMEKQEQKNEDIVELVTNEYSENGEAANIAILESIGNSALSQGIILMVNELDGEELFCMSTLDRKMCDSMLQSMQDHMKSVYPNFNGEYVQKNYDIVKNNAKVGTITLGYYGPFYYNEEDLHFLEVLNKLFIVIAIVFFVIATFLGYFIANRISRPIIKVIDKTKEIENGNYSNRLTYGSKTKEINQLIYSVNSLADTLEMQQNSKKRMAKDYAHEFRTPLAILQTNLEAMLDGIWEPTVERLESCQEEILRLTRMISDIDKIVKIENDSCVLHKSKFDLANVVEHIVITFEPELVSKHIKLETVLNKCEIYADKDKIVQVIINLLTNAIKYTNADGKIKITVNKNSNEAILMVADTGIGIAAEDLSNIFEHLYRTDKSRNRETGGSGIGLSIVKAIIDAHRGNIETKSEWNKGSEFKVTLPITWE